jgi:hypothetical protein
VLQRRQVGQRQSRPRRGRHWFQLYAKAVIRVVRIDGSRRRRVVIYVHEFNFVADCSGRCGGSNAAAAERPKLGQDEPPGVPALLEHRWAGVAHGRRMFCTSTARFRGNTGVSDEDEDKLVVVRRW